ncbi:UNVERIFIED_CONTAM: hypothetical protein H355_004549 [Colinus virginianus]|nr:hypothetical protein H355_004549 [Colinus virginianus]
MAAYKQWIPNTNFETASNWDKERVPCASDTIHFEKNKVVSVFVRSTHALMDMYLPLDGEFLLASGAGFAAFDGSWDPGCGSGEALSFANVEQHSWFNPKLWQDVSSSTDLESAGHIFLLDEERVPCQYDSVIFQPETSFRVNLDSSRQVISVRSISLMGQELSSTEAWAEYLGGPSAAWQFHGNATLQVTGTPCPHSSGCACGNSQVSAHAEGNFFPPKETGEGRAVVTMDFKPEFDLQQYRDRVVQEWLSLVLRLPRLWDRAEELDSPEPESGKGFDNPMFDVELPGAGTVEETLQEMAPEGQQVFYLNPLYDPSETEA